MGRFLGFAYVAMDKGNGTVNTTVASADAAKTNRSRAGNSVHGVVVETDRVIEADIVVEADRAVQSA